jgi:toxin ParE1/3/4
VLEIWEYIAGDNEAAADKFIDLLNRNFRLLGDLPHAGRRRDELRRGYRSFPVGEFLILYKVMKTGVSIMRVVHGRRNLELLFRH